MIAAMALINVGGSAAQVVFLFWYVKKLDLRLRPKWGLRGLEVASSPDRAVVAGDAGAQAAGHLGVPLGDRRRGADDREAAAGATRGTAARYPALLTLEMGVSPFRQSAGHHRGRPGHRRPSISRSAAGGPCWGAAARYTDTNQCCGADGAVHSGVRRAVRTDHVGDRRRRHRRDRRACQRQRCWWPTCWAGPFASQPPDRLFCSAPCRDARTPFLAQIPIVAVTLISVPVILTLVDPQYAAMSASATSLGNLLAWLFGMWQLRSTRHGTRWRRRACAPRRCCSGG